MEWAIDESASTVWGKSVIAAFLRGMMLLLESSKGFEVTFNAYPSGGDFYNGYVLRRLDYCLGRGSFLEILTLASWPKDRTWRRSALSLRRPDQRSSP